jgi:hypothetical protein
MEKRGNTIKQLITQFVLIVFSVVLGLYLSERIEEGKKRQESGELLRTIKSEVIDNLRLLEDWVPYHQAINKNLDRILSPFMSRRPASDAWDIAKSHPLIVNIDYDQWVILSRIYNQQETTFEPATEMIKLFESKNVNIGKDAKLNLELMANQIHELVAREEQLMYYYRKAEKILDLKNE